MGKRYFRLWLVALFCWIAVLGAKSGSWQSVMLPFLSLGALLLVREVLQSEYPEFGKQLAAVLTTFIILYNVYFSFPPVRLWLESQFPQTAAATGRLKEDIDLQASGRLEPVALAARKALQEHLLRKEDIVGARIKTELDVLDAKRQQGTFGPEDEKKEKEVLREFQNLVRDRAELQQLIAGTAAEELAPVLRHPTSQAPNPPLTEVSTSSKSADKSSAMHDDVSVTSNSQPSVSKDSPAESPPPPEPIKPVAPASGLPGDTTMSIQQCRHEGSVISCWGLISLSTDIPTQECFEQSSLADDLGNQYHILPGFTGGGLWTKMIPNVKYRFGLTIPDPHPAVQSLNFLIRIREECNNMGGYHEENDVVFTNVPVQK
jgi:hypothetical protein